MTYLLDTCILSKLRKIKRHPEKKLESWISKHEERSYFLSVLTLGEIQSGIAKIDGKTAEKKKEKMLLEDWLFGELIPRFRGRILDIDPKVALEWGRLVGEGKAKGRLYPATDSLIAATALRHQLILVTENSKDFEYRGLQVLNPC